MAIVAMALMVLSSLRYASYRSHEEEMAKKRKPPTTDAGTLMDDIGNGMHSRSEPVEVGAAEVLAAN